MAFQNRASESRVDAITRRPDGFREALRAMFDLDELVDIPPALLLLVNVIPLAGVLWLDWEIRGLLTLYWAENLIIGVSTLVKMFATAPLGSLFYGPFFVIHYGGFCAVHGLFIVALTSGDDMPELLNLGESWPIIFAFVELLVIVTKHIFSVAPPWWFLAFAALAISHGLSLVTNFFLRGEREGAEAKKLMASPYGRVVILHITIIFGGFAVMALDSPVALLVLLIVIKTIVDVFFHLNEHRKARSRG